jgi:hypothetical protein
VIKRLLNFNLVASGSGGCHHKGGTPHSDNGASLLLRFLLSFDHHSFAASNNASLRNAATSTVAVLRFSLFSGHFPVGIAVSMMLCS